MRSTFRVLFYTKNQAIKNGRVPVMGRMENIKSLDPLLYS